MSFGVFFLSRLRPGIGAGRFERLATELLALGSEGWSLNQHQPLGRAHPSGPRCYRSGAFQSCDVFGLLEAPDADAGHAGIGRLQAAGWDEAFESTMWITGPRDLPPVAGTGPHPNALGFLALWDWNDPWHAASPAERTEYDAECEVAFNFDVGLGIDLFGRFRTAAASGWEQVGFWECPSLETLTEAMGAHEVQNDFMFTTSSHFIGRATNFADLGRTES